MNDSLLHPTYFSSISHFVAILQADNLLFEHEDNYQKQTYRNRLYLCGPNGKQILSVPISHTQEISGRQKYKDIRIDYSTNWQKNHWQSLQTAYRSSAFFEFFEDTLYPIFSQKYDYLIDLNYASLEAIFSCLSLSISYRQTDFYQKEFLDGIDLRFLVCAKSEDNCCFEPYYQLFSDKSDFVSDLSILDLICNEGPAAVDYLRRQDLGLISFS